MDNPEYEPEDIESSRALLNKLLAVLARRENAPAALSEPMFADTLINLMLLVLERNESVNLTAITEPEEFVRLHLIDSLFCAGLPELESANSIIDVGSGAGFPGLPLAALYPDKRFLLIDSLRKRIEFASFAARKLGFYNVEALHMRAEKGGSDRTLREQFDLSLCRAVGKLPVILEYCLPFVRIGGAGYFFKTIPAAHEIEDSLLAREILGGSPEVRVISYRDSFPGWGHAIYIVSKERQTPAAYPRREGVPAKVPL